jgi:hypothetical protein
LHGHGRRNLQNFVPCSYRFGLTGEVFHVVRVAEAVATFSVVIPGLRLSAHPGMTTEFRGAEPNTPPAKPSIDLPRAPS